jgi:ADP-heptose:LPS heptosyltransferase
MRVMEVDKLVRVLNGGFCYRPFNRYVVSDFECENIVTKVDPMFGGHTNVRWSSFNAHERRYGGQDLNGKKVCIYRHNAWGDQLIISAVPMELKKRFPGALVHLYCHPDVMELWRGCPFIDGAAIPLPIPLDAVRKYDYVIFYEGMLEGNREEDQNNCYDDFFGVIGLNDVPPESKRPAIVPLPSDYRLASRFVNLNEKYVLYHMSPNNLNRMYPPKLGRKVIETLAREYPDYKIYVIGLDKDKKYGWVCEDMPENVVDLLSKTHPFRATIPMVERCRLLICPDSAFMHMAAAFPTVPVISLWGLFHPQDRIKYYTNNTPLFAFDACPHAPCRDHNFFLPYLQCRDSEYSKPEFRNAERAEELQGKIEYCYALAEIKPERVLEVAREKLSCDT